MKAAERSDDVRTARPGSVISRLGRHGIAHWIGGFGIAACVSGATLGCILAGVGGVVGLYLLPVAALVGAMLMPTPQFLAGYALFHLLGAGVLYVQHLFAASQPSHHGGAGEAIGLLLVASCIIGVGLGAVLNILSRFVVRLFQSRSAVKRS